MLSVWSWNLCSDCSVMHKVRFSQRNWSVIGKQGVGKFAFDCVYLIVSMHTTEEVVGC
jgi:hypothetical protein